MRDSERHSALAAQLTPVLPRRELTRASHSRPRMPRHTDHHVLDYGHVSEQLQRLKRPHDSLPRGHVHGSDFRVRAINIDAPAVSSVRSGDNIDQRRLAGTVRPDESVNRSGGDAHAHIGQRDETAERARHIFDLQFRAGNNRHGDGRLVVARILRVRRALRLAASRRETADAVREKIKRQDQTGVDDETVFCRNRAASRAAA